MAEHDQLFKELLRIFFGDFLRLVLPRMAERLGLSKAVFLDKELFTDWPRGRRREPDLLARVPLLGPGDRFVLVHVEIQARAEPGIGMRLRNYRNQIQARYEHPVVSVVVFLSRGRPGVHLEILEEDLPFLELGAFRYLAFGLEGCDAVEYLARPEPLAWGLAALMRRSPMTRAQHKLACLRRIAAADLSGDRRLVLVNCVETYLELTPEEAAEFAALLSPEESQEAQTMVMTWADRMKEEGRVVGRREALEEARTWVDRMKEESRVAGRKEALEEARTWADRMKEEGQRIGIQQTLLRQLDRRFGPLPPAIPQRVEAIDSVERLDRLAEQVLTARSLDELDFG